MKNLKTIFALASIFILSFNSLACRCAQNDSLTKERVDKAAAIFSGEVLRIDENKETYTATIFIKVDRAIKGVKKGETIQVKTSMSSASCGITTEVGQIWYMMVTGGSEGYHVSICDRKRMLSRNCSSIGTSYEEMELKDWAQRKEDFENDIKIIKKLM